MATSSPGPGLGSPSSKRSGLPRNQPRTSPDNLTHLDDRPNLTRPVRANGLARRWPGRFSRPHLNQQLIDATGAPKPCCESAAPPLDDPGNPPDGMTDREPARARPKFRVVSLRDSNPANCSRGSGMDYTLMGGQWDNSTAISYSIAPDGVNWDQGTNACQRLRSTPNTAGLPGKGWSTGRSRPGRRPRILTSPRSADGPYDFNASGINQGDPSFGDIRIGGYNFGNYGGHRPDLRPAPQRPDRRWRRGAEHQLQFRAGVATMTSKRSSSTNSATPWAWASRPSRPR